MSSQTTNANPTLKKTKPTNQKRTSLLPLMTIHTIFYVFTYQVNQLSKQEHPFPSKSSFKATKATPRIEKDKTYQPKNKYHEIYQCVYRSKASLSCIDPRFFHSSHSFKSFSPKSLQAKVSFDSQS